MPCALEVIDTRLQRTSHIRCNRSFDRNICSHFSKDHLIRKPVYVRPENRDTALTVLPLGHDSDWKPAQFLSGIQEANKVIPLTSEDPGIERQCAQPRILCCLGQPNEGNMHDQADSAEPASNGNPHGGSTLIQSRQKKNVCNSLTASPPCHVVAKKLSRPVTTILSDSDILHDDDKPSKRNPRRKGNKKGKQYRRVAHKKLNLTSEIAFEDNTYGVSPVDVLPTSLPVDNLSETTSSACSLVKEAHVGKSDGEKNNAYAKSVTMMNSSTLGTDEVDGSDCACSSNSVAGGRLSCSFVPYLNGESNTTDSSEFDGSTFSELGLGEERNSKKLPCACVYKPDCATTDYFFSRWNDDNNGNFNANVEATLAIKDENRHDRLQLGPSTGSKNVRSECQLLESHLSFTHAEDTIGPLGSRSCSSKDITDSCIHTERVQCSSEACSSKPSLQISSRRTGKSRKTPSYIDLTVSHRVAGANRHRNNGRDTSAVWQKVERNGKIISKGHSGNSPVQDKGAHEDNYKGAQEDPTKLRAKHNQNRKAYRQEFPNGAVELDSTKEEDAFSSCQTFSRPIYKKQAPFLCQQRSSSSKQGSQSSKNYYAPRNGIPKVPKVYLHQEELPMSQLVQAMDPSDRSTSNSCSADEVVTGGGSNCPNAGNESSQSGIEIAASVSCNSVPELAPQGDSDDAHISDPHSLCPENTGVSTSWSSRNLCTDPCAAEPEEAWCVKLTTENNSQESCKWYSPAGQLSQKWVPVGKKETSNVIHLDFQEALVVEDSVPANDISYSVGPVSSDGEDSKLSSECEMTSKLNSLGHLGLECRAHNGTETDYSRIKEAISYVYTAQQRVEDIHRRIGRPIADFEQFVYSASPVVHCNPCIAGCTSYLQECLKDGLHLHQTPEMTLSSVWQWYEEQGCYGLEVKAQDFHRSKDFSSSHCQFTSYFVPYLSAVQLFAQPKRSKGGSTDQGETSPNLNPPPIFAKLLPQQSNSRNRSSTLCAEDQANGKLIFEFFESEQPYCRRQLFDKVNELIAGVKQLNCQISGDPKSLELSLHDLHPASWYCVAWYPIFRIPDGKFQAAFLTYHSLGHWTHRSSGADLGVVLPVVGLQSYNDKAERWFEMGELDPCEDGGTAELRCSEASQALKQRLNEAAAAMSRASVLKEEQTSRNRHPDYEFFISRRCG